MPGTRLVYWDVGPFLRYVERDPDWINIVSPLLDESASRQSDLHIVTSTLTVAQVAYRSDEKGGELSDAASALDWMQMHNPNAPACWIAGFSFGAWISMQLMMRRPEITGFISIAPPASTNDFTFLAPCPASGLILHGSDDEVVPVGSVDKLAQKLSSQKNIVIDYRVVKGCNHFFTEHLDTLVGHIDDYLEKSLVEAA